jgi:hypothetical protein
MVLRKIKPEIRVIGIDDSPFDRKTKAVLLVGAVFRSGLYLEGILSCHVKRDGTDATDKIIRMVNRSKHKGQLRLIMLNGIAVGGFNVIDIEKLYKKTSLPVIVIVRWMPDFEKIKRALSKFKDAKKRFAIIEKAGEVNKINLKGKALYYQKFGIIKELAEEVIRISATHSLVPEPIRVAHIIGSGIVLGETKGRV